MNKKIVTSVAILFCLVVFAVCIVPATASAAGESSTGIVVLHGKTGTPEFYADSITASLKKAGYLVEVPGMSWSKNRFIDKTYEDSLNEIDLSVNALRKKGATRVVIAGHSMGGNAALAYAAYHGGVEGIILLAPGHAPDAKSFMSLVAADVARAKAMIEKGAGNQMSTFIDTNMGQTYIRNMKAEIYYSFFRPDGLGAMRKSASMLPLGLPVLYIAASADPLTTTQGKGYLFSQLPENPLTRYVIVTADHLGIRYAAIGEVLAWLSELSNL